MKFTDIIICKSDKGDSLELNSIFRWGNEMGKKGHRVSNFREVKIKDTTYSVCSLITKDSEEVPNFMKLGDIYDKSKNKNKIH